MHSKRNPYSEDSAKVAHIDKEVSCQIHIYTFILTRLLARLLVCSFPRLLAQRQVEYVLERFDCTTWRIVIH